MKMKFVIAGVALALVGGGMLVGSHVYACGKNSKSASASGTACCSKMNSATASVTTASANEKSFSKDACINWLMANENMTREQAETAYSAWLKSEATSGVCAKSASAGSVCASKANATCASHTASGVCPYMQAKMAVSDADAVAWLMVTKGLSEDQAQARFAACSETRAAARTGAQTASAHCSQADCVKWLMANKGMTRTQAEAAFASCAKTKATAQVALLAASAGKEAKTEATSSTSTSSTNY